MKTSPVPRAARARRALFCVGPGDVVGSFRYWGQGIRTPGENALTYSGQTLDFCRRAGLDAWLVSSHPNVEVVREGQFVVENRPKSKAFGETGVGYHLREIAYGLSIVWTAAKYRPSVAVVDTGTTHWFVLSLLGLLGISVVPSFHNAYYPPTNPPIGTARRIIALLDGWFFRRCTPAAIGVSPECGRQYRQIARRAKPYLNYYPQFIEQDFNAHSSPPRHDAPVFVILFAGRVEENKGALDLVEMAVGLREKGRRAFRIDVCGAGEALEELRRRIDAEGLEDLVVLHGQLQRDALLPMFAAAHVVVVPTRSNFVEGLAKVCAEAVLSGKPVVTSKVVPALEVIGGAAVEAKPDDVESYVHALLKLMNDESLYRDCVLACSAAREPFLDPDFGLDTALARLLGDHAHRMMNSVGASAGSNG